MSKGFTDWPDLGFFPLQDVEDGVPIGMRMALVGGRVKVRPQPGEGGRSKVTEYAREHSLGTLGDVHPWLFWQTKDRDKRAMGSWSMAWGGIVTDSADVRYGGSAGVQPLTRNGAHQVNDIRYRVLQPAWQGVLPWQPEGMLAMVMPTTDEAKPSSVMLNGDRRLVAANVSGPGQAGTTIVDMQPEGVLCMDGSNTPGMGGRHARLQGLVRVIALTQGSAPLLGGSPLNSIAINYGASQQDGILGHGMVYGPAIGGGGGGGGGGPTTGQTGPNRAITPNDMGRGAGPGAPPPPENPGGGSFAGPGGGSFDSNGPEGPNAGIQTSVANFGSFQSEAQSGHAVGFMSASASGPIMFGCGKHRVGTDKDGHPMTSAHIASGAYFYDSGDRDGPLMFEGRFPDNVGDHSIPSLVHLSWDEKATHGFIGGNRPGKWRWWTTVPYVESEDDDEEEEKEPPETPTTPSTPSTPSGPSGPTTGTPSTPSSPTTPGAGSPNAPVAPDSPGAPTAPASPYGPATPNDIIKPASPATPNDIIKPSGPGRAVTPLRPRKPVAPPDNPHPAKPPNEPPGRPVTYPEGTQRPQPVMPVDPGVSVFSGRGTDFRGLESTATTVRTQKGPAGVVATVGGSASGRDVGLYSILHPFNTGFAAISFRPQLQIKGAPNFEHNPLLSARAYRAEERTRPSVLTLRAWGAQSQSGDWDYIESPASSRARGGSVNGGLLFAPSEFEMEDYLGINSNADTDNPAAATFVTFAPTVAVAFGKPTTGGILAAGAKIIRQDTAAGEVVVSEVVGAVGATTDILKMSLLDSEGYLELEGTGAVKIPSGTTGKRPSTPVVSMLRVNTTLTALEYYAAGAWQVLTPGGGGGAVDSVNGQTGVVVLDPDDLDDSSTTNKFITAAELSKLSGIEALAEVNTVDSVAGKTGAVLLDLDDVSNGTARFAMTVAHKTMADNIDVIADDTMVGNNSGVGGAPMSLTPAEVKTMQGFPVVSSGSANPTTTPATIGDIYHQTTDKLKFEAYGTASSADWRCEHAMAKGYWTLNGSSAPTLDKAKNLTLTKTATTGVYEATMPSTLPNTDSAGKDYVFHVDVMDATGNAGGIKLWNILSKTATVVRFIIRDGTGAASNAADALEITITNI